MNRQEVAIHLAKINMINKQLTCMLELNENVERIKYKFDLNMVPILGKEILDFLQQNNCHNIVIFITTMYSTEFLQKIVDTRKEKYDKTFISQINNLISTIDKFNNFAALYKKKYKAGKYELLEDIFANPKIRSFFPSYK